MSVRRTAWGVLGLVAVLSLATARAAPPPAARPKKLIAVGWDMPDVEHLRRCGPQIEACPFDGLAFDVAVADAPDRIPFARLFNATQWSRAWFEPALADLKKLPTARPLDKFLRVSTLPGGVDWFDDEGWRNIVAHWRIAASLVCQAGLKGILFDPEAYAPKQALFLYRAQPQAARHDFAQYCAQARRRGREVMRAVAEECPELTLFCMFMNSGCGTATGQIDPQAVLHEHLYGLFPAFIDGWLDAAPPALTFVDGCEQAYLFNNPQQFLQAGHLIRGPCQQLVSPENRAKYRAQVQVGFGIFLDAYCNPKASPWYVDGQGGSRVARLGANVASAFYVADEYVWLYGEQFRWWPTDCVRVQPQTWPEVLPFCDNYLRCARDPLGYARARLERRSPTNKLASLVRNGHFAPEPAAAPAAPPGEWTVWQDPHSHGTLAGDRQTGRRQPGAARIQGAANACFVQTQPVKPGERYIVRAYCRLAGRGEAFLQVRWQTAPGQWSADAPGRLFFAAGERRDWRELFGVVEVPAGVTQLALLLSVCGQATPADQAWFDDVEMFPLVLEDRTSNQRQTHGTAAGVE